MGGEYAPMPPVFGPLSPSCARLKSRAGASGITSVPSVTASIDSSGPSRSSSTTTVAPLRPNRPCTSIASIAASASSTFVQTTTPLPRARPSALTATRPSRWPAQDFAGCGCVKTSNSAVGIPARTISCLANDLLDSMRPAPRFGPNTLKPELRSASPTPASTAASGPRMTRPSRSCLANSTIRTTSAAPMGMFRAMPTVPPLPGAQYTRSTSSDCTHFHTNACSRAPDPTTRTFTPELLHHELFPLDGAGRLARDVVDDPVDALHLVHYPVADARQHLIRDACPVRGHRVLAGHNPHGDHIRVSPVVAHHPHRLKRSQHCER